MINQKFRILQVVESINAIIWEYDIVMDSWDYVSPQSKKILGYDPEEWLGLDFWVKNVHEEDRSWAKNYCLRATKQGKDHVFEYRFMKKNGDYIWIRDEVVVIMENNKPIKIRGFMTDISELKKREEHIKYMSFHDELTGLYNRRFFDKELKRYDNSKHLPLTIIIGDMNNLKFINDNYGHETGDNYLKLAATIIESKARKNDVVTRWGGDEFAIIMPSSNSSDAIELISNIKGLIDENNYKNGEISIAFGYHTKTSISEDIQDVFRIAEINMYKDKKISNL